MRHVDADQGSPASCEVLVHELCQLLVIVGADLVTGTIQGVAKTGSREQQKIFHKDVIDN